MASLPDGQTRAVGVGGAHGGPGASLRWDGPLVGAGLGALVRACDTARDANHVWSGRPFALAVPICQFRVRVIPAGDGFLGVRPEERLGDVPA